jgi:hypothetical protein
MKDCCDGKDHNHLRIVDDVDSETSEEEDERTFSERWEEKKHKRWASVRQSQKDLRFTLGLTSILLFVFIATVLADIFLV